MIFDITRVCECAVVRENRVVLYLSVVYDLAVVGDEAGVKYFPQLSNRQSTVRAVNEIAGVIEEGDARIVGEVVKVDGHRAFVGERGARIVQYAAVRDKH